MNKKQAQELAAMATVDNEAGRMSLQEYHDKIIVKSREGKYVMVERGRIKPDTSAKLQEEGFKVRCSFDNESSMYWTRVSWEKDKTWSWVAFIAIWIVAFSLTVLVGLAFGGRL